MNLHTNPRVFVIFSLFVLLYIILIVNLYTIQVRHSTFFSTLGQQQYHFTVTTMPVRAEINDRNGQPLALNKDSLAAFIIPQRLEQPHLVATFLKKHFTQAHQRLDKNKQSQFMYLKRRLTEKEIELIRASNLVDIKFLKEPSRFYPSCSMAHVVGITNIDNQGVLGIEQLYDAQLAGKPSTYMLEKDARSGHFYFQRTTTKQGSQGQPVTLTLDSNLQFLVYEELKDTIKELGSQEGAVLIVNPDTGEVLVMAEYPDFDPNRTTSITISNTKNRITTDAYEFGSVIKAFLAAAALEEKLVTADELIDCENATSFILDGVKFTTWKSNGILSFSEVIQFSNNIGVAKVAMRLGAKLYEHYTRLGFCKKTGILQGENKGFITPVKAWTKASIVSLSFGYEIRATLMQLAQAFNAITHEGLLMPLHIIKNDISVSYLPTKPLYKIETIRTIRDILSRAVLTYLPGYTVLGKTGTARLITNGKYDPQRHIFTFMGLIEKDSYRRIIITFIKETTQKGAYASTTAMPLFKKVAQQMLIHDKMA
jgi:cell division protein FtsI (penicillin-binding protein 3)